MTMQSFLNEIHDEIYNCCLTNLEFRLTVSIIILIITAFSVYGWLCTTQIIRNNMGFCNESFSIAICSEVILAIFIIPPMILRCILNCIVSENPRVQNSTEITGSSKSLTIAIPTASAYSNHTAVPQPHLSIPNHAYLSFNKLYAIQEKRKNKLQETQLRSQHP